MAPYFFAEGSLGDEHADGAARVPVMPRCGTGISQPCRTVS